jgi:hypothetical protein
MNHGSLCTVGLYEMHETSGQNMVIQLESLLSNFGLMHCVIALWKMKVIIW